MTITGTELSEYYGKLLIAQYRGKPKAVSVIESTAYPATMPLASDDTPLPLAIQNAFNIDTAVGVQLDILGKYIGAKRSGFDFSGPVTLNDTQYRQLLKILIARNIMTATLKDIQAFIHIYFSGVIKVFDRRSMSVHWYYLVKTGTNIVAEFFIKLGKLPRPQGVGEDIIYAYTSPATAFFGLRTYASPAPDTVYPLNTYADYVTTWPMMLYQYLIEV